MPKNTRIMNLKYLPMHSEKIKNHNFSFLPQHDFENSKREEKKNIFIYDNIGMHTRYI